MLSRIQIGERILQDNDRMADEVRSILTDAGVFAINLMASPGAGKTSLIEQTLRRLGGDIRTAVIEGDLATSLDAERASAAGAAAVQINTGNECHLDAYMIRQALDELDLPAADLLIVENVGNLICPAAFRLGTHANVVVASVPEGDDKPWKYPATYHAADLVVLNKTDLLPYVPFNVDGFRRGAQAANTSLPILLLSCRTGDGLPAWIDWLEAQVRSAQRTGTAVDGPHLGPGVRRQP
jgi:hydrogenase nickel incorporation protein HypB